VLFDVEKARGAKLKKIDGYVMSPTGKRLLIQTETKSIYRRSFTAVYYIYHVANNKLEPLSDGGPQQTPVWSPDGEQVAFVRDNNIHLVKLLYNNAESQVTKDGKFNEVINGIPDWVNEEEFSFNSSMVFTADSKQIVWIRYDESQVKEYSMPMFHLDAENKGAYAYTPEICTFSPALPVRAIDTTGAGDGFTGAFLKKLSEFCTEREGLSHLSVAELQSCLTFANKFCAFSVQHHGAIASYPTAEQMLVNTL
jgi:dipeptidyl-peptidase-4